MEPLAKTIELSSTSVAVINLARRRRPEWIEEPDDYIIFSVLTEWLSKDGEQGLNEWIREFF
jgi:hypothetical protein